MLFLDSFIKTRIQFSRFMWILLVFVAYFSVLGFEIPLDSQGQLTGISHRAALRASADPTETASFEEAKTEQKRLLRPKLFISATGTLPSWATLQLDETLNIDLLDSSFRLNQTQGQLGAEYFSYSNYLFAQILSQIIQETDDPETISALQDLIKNTNELKTYVTNSGKTWFDGTPTANMDHLQIRSYIMANLNPLNTGSIHRMDYDAQGDIQDYSIQDTEKKPGKALQRFLKTSETLKQTDFMQTHPETLNLIVKQTQLLNDLAMNLELRWESRLITEGRTSKVTRMRLFAEQTLRIDPKTMATFASIMDIP